jgi:acetylornithine deacetylase
MNKNFLDIYRKLIAIPSSSSDNKIEDLSNEPVIDLLITFLSQFNFKCKKIPVVNSKNKFNLIASYGHGTGGLALCGHTDTVPTIDNLWNQSPYELTQDNNRLYGLGVIDMKGFFAFIVETLFQIDFSKLKKPLHILATADEETTMSGAIQLVKEFNAKPDLIIIGEPTSLVPVIMHKGHLVQKITATGISGHSSNPDSGINAILIIYDVISELCRLKDTLKNDFSQKMFPIPYPTLNIGQILGGDAPNRICEQCSITFDIRPIPGTSIEQMKTETLKALEKVMKKYPNRIKISQPYDAVEPFGGFLPQEDLTFIEEITNKKAIAVNYATEATYYQNLAPTIILGAGSIDVAHQPNEYLNIEEIQPMLSILNKLINKYCF